MNPVGTLVLALLALAASAASAQNSPILDTSGQPLRRGVEYVIKPAITDAGGPFTLISRNGVSCPLYVGQRNVTADVLSVTFAPFDEAEGVVRESKDFRVTFSATSICVQSTAWRVEHFETVAERRLIAAGEDPNERGFSNYFKISTGDVEGSYKMEWCPAELCPTCRFHCGFLGSLFENGQRLAALDGSALPLVFERLQA